MKDVAAQVVALQDLTRRTGIVHEAQLLQLRFWPKLLFGTVSSKATVDVERFRIEYEIRTGAGPVLDAERLAVLARWTHELFGEEYRVTIVVLGVYGAGSFARARQSYAFGAGK